MSCWLSGQIRLIMCSRLSGHIRLINSIWQNGQICLIVFTWESGQIRLIMFSWQSWSNLPNHVQLTEWANLPNHVSVAASVTVQWIRYWEEMKYNESGRLLREDEIQWTMYNTQRRWNIYNESGTTLRGGKIYTTNQVQHLEEVKYIQRIRYNT